MFRRIAIAAALCLGLAAPAMAFLDPPARFDKPHPGGTTKYYFARSNMHARCVALLGRDVHPRTVGCASSASGRCIIYMAQEVRSYPDLHDRLFRHERAHCNGWVHARPAEGASQ